MGDVSRLFSVLHPGHLIKPHPRSGCQAHPAASAPTSDVVLVPLTARSIVMKHEKSVQSSVNVLVPC